MSKGRVGGKSKSIRLAASLRSAVQYVFNAALGLAAFPADAPASIATASEAPEALYSNGFDAPFPTDGNSNVVIDLPGDERLDARLYAPAAPNGSAVVLMHGCSGLWSNGHPRTVAQTAIERWGRKFAEAGTFALAVDSFTARTPDGVDDEAFQHQCVGDPYGTAVDPYTTRVADIDRAIAWLRYRLGVTSTARLALLGWSQGGESVLVHAAETSRDSDVPWNFDVSMDARTARASVVFYPGCGSLLGFVDDELDTSFWRPHRDLRINHGGADALHADCTLRASIALTRYESLPESGHWIDYVQYEGAQHSFDTTITDWPDEPCAPGSPNVDACAAASADLDSFEFLMRRLSANHGAAGG